MVSIPTNIFYDFDDFQLMLVGHLLPSNVPDALSLKTGLMGRTWVSFGHLTITEK